MRFLVMLLVLGLCMGNCQGAWAQASEDANTVNQKESASTEQSPTDSERVQDKSKELPQIQPSEEKKGKEKKSRKKRRTKDKGSADAKTQ